MVKCEKKIDLEAKLTDYSYIANNFEMEKYVYKGSNDNEDSNSVCFSVDGFVKFILKCPNC